MLPIERYKTRSIGTTITEGQNNIFLKIPIPEKRNAITGEAMSTNSNEGALYNVKNTR